MKSIAYVRAVGRVLLQLDRAAGRDGRAEQDVGLVVDVPRAAGARRVARAGLVAVQPGVVRGQVDAPCRKRAVDVDVERRGGAAAAGASGMENRATRVLVPARVVHCDVRAGRVERDRPAAGRLTGEVADGPVRADDGWRRRRRCRPPPRTCRTACSRRGRRRAAVSLVLLACLTGSSLASAASTVV